MVRFPNQGRQPEDVEIWTHSNETLATVRRQILTRIKSGHPVTVPVAIGNPQLIHQQQQQQQPQQQQQQQQQQQPQQVTAQQQQGLKLDLYLNNELIEPSEGYRLVAELPLRDKTVSWCLNSDEITIIDYDHVMFIVLGRHH